MRYYYNVIVSPDHSNSTVPDGQALRTSDRGNVVVLVLTEQNRFPRFTFFADDGRLVAVWAGWQCGAAVKITSSQSYVSWLGPHLHTGLLLEESSVLHQ